MIANIVATKKILMKIYVINVEMESKDLITKAIPYLTETVLFVHLDFIKISLDVQNVMILAKPATVSDQKNV